MKKLKINNLSEGRFNEKELNKITGGQEKPACPGNCCCLCQYANQGGSSVAANSSANEAHQLTSPGCYD